jgi:hypothetical protein
MYRFPLNMLKNFLTLHPPDPTTLSLRFSLFHHRSASIVVLFSLAPDVQRGFPFAKVVLSRVGSEGTSYVIFHRAANHVVLLEALCLI